MPGLSGSLWSSVSGLLTHGQKMNVVTNNIANVSTIGFKAQRMDFNDYLYIGGGSTSGPTQIGAGVSVYAVLGDFSQGSLESTNSVTDIAIDGNGFFAVRATNSREKFFTRAGDFYFNTDRELQNPEGMVVQGWKVNNEKSITFSKGATTLGVANEVKSPFVGYGTPQDIVLDSWNVKPQQTTNIAFTMGLTNSIDQDKTTSMESPMTAMFDSWDANQVPPIADKAYATQSSIDVYDEGGSTHTLTVYYDLVAPDMYDTDGNLIYEIKGLPSGYTMYEYLVTIPPDEDNRSYGGTQYNQVTNEFDGKPSTKFYHDPETGLTKKNAGVVMTGVMIFDASGQLVNQTAYTYGGVAKPDLNNQYNGDPDSRESWQPTRFSTSGLPVFSANFTGHALGNTVNERLRTSAGGDEGTYVVENYIMELDFGLRNSSASWNPEAMSVNQVLRDAKTGDALSKKAPGGTTPLDPADYIRVGSSKFGYYFYNDNSVPPRTGEFYGMAATVEPGKWVQADNLGYYIEDNIGGEDRKVYGILGPDDTKVIGNGGKYMIVAENFYKPNDDPRTTEYYTTGSKPGLNPGDPAIPITVPVYKSADGYYYTQTTSNDPEIYGTYTAPIAGATTEDVYHDTYGFYVGDHNGADDDRIYGYTKGGVAVHYSYQDGYYTGNAPTRIAIDKSDFVAVSETYIQVGHQKVSPETRVVVNENTKPDIATDYRGNSLAALTTIGVPNGTVDSKGVPHTKYVVDYSAVVPGMDAPVRVEGASVANVASPTVRDAIQDGYGSGTLSSVNINTNGVIEGYFTNGQTLPLYQIAIYDFKNYQGLRREGGNLYGKTMESGEARLGVAGDNGFGTTRAYNIEQSNVDMAREFVQMISTQRGFQANSKGVTTVDTMLETVIGMKR